MKKILFLLFGLIIWFNQQSNAQNEFPDFSEELKIEYIEESDGWIIDAVNSVYEKAKIAVDSIAVRQSSNNAIIVEGNKRIDSLNQWASALQELVNKYFSQKDSIIKTELCKYIQCDPTQDDETIAIIIAAQVEEMKLKGEMINQMQDESILQNNKDKVLIEILINEWGMVLKNIQQYFSTSDQNERKVAKANLVAVLNKIKAILNQ